MAPPPLSAYALALLGESSNDMKAKLRGIQEKQERDDSELKSNLRAKLAMVSKDASRPSFSNPVLQNLSGSTSSSHSYEHKRDDFMDITGESLRNPMTSATSPAGGMTAMSSRPVSGILSKKRSRTTRRFHSLGPPQRACAKSDEVQDCNSSGSLSPPTYSTYASEDIRKTSKTIDAMKTRTPSPEMRKTLTADSDFFRDLKRLQNSVGIERLNPDHEPPLARADRVDIFHDSQNGNPFRRPVRPTSRPPLHEKSLNSELQGGGFRKPKTAEPSAPKRLHVETPSTTPAHSVLTEDSLARRKFIQINGNSYEKLELLGRGGSSKVYKVRASSSKSVFAVKKVTIDQFDEACVKEFKGEVDLLNKLRNEPRVVTLVDHAFGSGNIFLVMECGDLDLAHVFSTRLGSGCMLDVNFVRFHAKEILCCVEAVHRAGIVHSDLKPANFLFVKGLLKIIDFGIANAVPEHTSNIYRESQIGTPNYMAPEALVDTNLRLGLPVSHNSKSGSRLNTWRVGRPSDIWSCGCIIYQMVYGRPPYASYSGQQRIMAIMNADVKIQYPPKGIGGIKVPASALELMQHCLMRNPSERWTVSDCLECDFLKPKAVSEKFILELVHSAVDFGATNGSEISEDIYKKLVDTVVKQIADLNYA